MPREGRYYDRWSKRVAFYALLVALMLGLGMVMVLQPSGVLNVAGGFLIVLSLQTVSYAVDSKDRPTRASFRYDDSSSSVNESRSKYYSSEYRWRDKAERFAQLVDEARGDQPPHYFHAELKRLAGEVESSFVYNEKMSPDGVLVRAFSILEDAVAERLYAEAGNVLDYVPSSRLPERLPNRRISRHKILSELKNRGEDINRGENIPLEAVEAFELLWEMRNRAAHEDDGTSPSRKTVMKILDATLELEGLLASRPA